MKALIAILIIGNFNLSLIADGKSSQWRGPSRDGKYPAKNLLKQWPTAGPELLWEKLSLGSGHSSPAVIEDKIFITGMINEKGILTCFDLDGNQLWTADYGPEWNKNYPGARSTPTVIANYLYLISGNGRLVCIDTDTGKERWSVELFKKFFARNIEWGFNESPLIDGDRLICTPGGPNENIVALNRFDGETVWISKGNGEPSAYCSPLLIEHKSKKQIVTRTAKSVLGIEPETGAVLWRFPQSQEYDIQANTPLYHDGRLFCLTGANNSSGAVLLELSDDGKKVKQRWQNKKADNLIGGVILAKGYLFSSRYDRGEWFCLNWQSGEIAYMTRNFGGGPVIYADDLFYCYSEKGYLGLISANDKKFEVISSFKIEKGKGPHWANPVIREGRLYVRHGEALMVYNISKN